MFHYETFKPAYCHKTLKPGISISSSINNACTLGAFFKTEKKIAKKFLLIAKHGARLEIL